MLRPLFAPDAEADRARFEAFAKGQREAVERLQRRGHAQSERLTEVMREVEQLRKQTSGLRARLSRQLQFSERVLKRVSERSVEIGEERVFDRLARIGRSSQAVLVGPWTGEVGFELIYWVPFLRWALGHAGIDPARVTVFSRGGARPWYDGLANEYVDALDFTTADEFRTRTAVSRKQRGLTAFDRDLLRRACAARGGAPALIHPAMMYALFYPYWRREAPLARVLEYVRPRRHEPPAPPAVPLPDDYVAVRFYFSDCFPDTPGNRAFVSAVIGALADRHDVVVLHAGLGLDDHADTAVHGRDRVHVIDAGVSPRDNLALQTAIIARARAFVGTYGGFSYLAPLHGVDTVAFYSDRNFQVSHLHMAQHISAEVGGGTLVPLDVAHAALLQDVLPGSRSPAVAR